jgi:GAF domain-containing protein
MLPDPNDSFDQALMSWFVRHQYGWSGTSSELIAAVNNNNGVDCGSNVWRLPARALYAHLESRMESLQSSGIDVLLHPGFPRMVTLRTSRGRKASGYRPSDEYAVHGVSCLTNEAHSFAESKGNHPVSELLAERSAISRAAGDPGKSAHGECTDHPQLPHRDDPKGQAFEDTARALFGIVEMRGRIKEQGLDLISTMQLVANRTHAITGSSGIVLGWLQQDRLVFPAQVGSASALEETSWQANLLRSCINKGAVLSMPEAQQDPLVGTSCRRDNIKSVIVAPIYQDCKVAGAMELLFSQARCFSSGDVMTLELIADLISEQLVSVARDAATEAVDKQTAVPLRITESFEPQTDEGQSGEMRWDYSQEVNSAAASEVFPNYGPNTLADLVVSASTSAPRRRVWTRLP